jgi:hypothetical protein
MKLSHHSAHSISNICKSKNGKWLADRLESASNDQNPDQEQLNHMKILASCILHELHLDNRMNKVGDLAKLLWIIAHPEKNNL